MNYLWHSVRESSWYGSLTRSPTWGGVSSRFLLRVMLREWNESFVVSTRSRADYKRPEDTTWSNSGTLDRLALTFEPDNWIIYISFRAFPCTRLDALLPHGVFTCNLIRLRRIFLLFCVRVCVCTREERAEMKDLEINQSEQVDDRC